MPTFSPRLLSILVATTWLASASPASAQDAKIWLDGPLKSKTRVDSVAELVERVSPSIVNVIVAYGAGTNWGGFFEAEPEWPDSRSAQGSGFIIHPTGYVLTNNHVVEGAENIKVRLNDDREFDVEVVGVDPQTDVALMRIVASGVAFPTVVLGNSDGVRVGERVVAIGNPLGLSHTVTAGIVSALERRDLAPGGRQLYSEFIQTDASINPGNSGGPLFSMSGAVIGINTAINREGQGIGFAIPINIVKTLLPHLQKNGYVVRTWLGIRMQEVSLPLARSFGLDRPQGALVTEVISGGPAEKGGVLAGDLILSFAGKKIRQSDMLPWLASTAGTEGEVEVELLRSGKRKQLKLRLEEQPNQKAPILPRSNRVVPADGGEARPLGVEVGELSTSLARQLGAQGRNGVVVTEISEESPARESGLRRRDVVLQVGDKPVETPEQFVDSMAVFAAGDAVRLKVVRGGRVVYIAFDR